MADEKRERDKEVTAEKILKDFKTAYDAKSEWLEVAKSDIEFTYGNQWNDDDVKVLEGRGVKPLSINKIKPKIQLITGIESQNRSDINCYPEGGEDRLKSEVATALVKHVMKQANGDYKVSEQFELALNVGEGFIEPYMDHTYDLLNGTMKFRVREYDSVFYDPDAREYDLSDAKYLCVLTQKLTKDELIEMFPEKEKAILNGKGGRIDFMGSSTATDNGKSYDTPLNSADESVSEDAPYDLIEYYYHKYVKKIYVADRKLGKITEAANEEAASQYEMAGNMEMPGSVKIIPRYIPEVWRAAVSGKDKLGDEAVWSYPAYKGYHFIPNFCYRAPGKLSKLKYSVQGMPRGLKDLNIELNKRRTQELHILNTSANSGWQYEQGTLTPEQEKTYQQFGSAPGILLVHQPGKPPPSKIVPTPLSQGHAQLAAENSQDIKEASGINDDLLSMNEGQSSGRAIMLRQKQGMVMVQKIFDNLSQTKRLLGRFILSQLGRVFDVETAMKVMGEEFCTANFQAPVMQMVRDQVTGQVVIDPSTAQPAQQPAVDSMTGQPVTQYDENACKQFFNDLLNDAELGKYDVAVGESASSETVKFANFMTLKELAQAGIPVPPEVIIEGSSLSEATVAKIKQAQQQQMAMQQQQMQMAPAPKQEQLPAPTRK